MPLGWYLAQGLIPLEPSSSDDEEGPVELPNGRLVCGPHGLVLCGKCCTDYSFMEDVLYDDGGDGISDHFDSDTEAMYWDLDPATRAQVDAKWGPSASRQSENHTSTTVDTDPADEAVVVTTSKSTSLPTNFSEDSFGLKKVKGTGRIFPTRFYPPSNSITPTGLFSGRKTIGRLTRSVV